MGNCALFKGEKYLTMKVLFVSGGNNKYGIVPFIKSQGESLKENGVELDYFTIKGKGIKGYLSNIIPLRKVIKEGNYDIIHSHYTFCGWTSLLADFRANHIISFMGSDTYGEFDEKGKRKFSSLGVVLLAQMIQPFMKGIIVKSDNLAAYIYNKKKLNIVPNGVDFNRFQPLDKKEARKKLGIDEHIKSILFLSNPANPRKNFKLISDAMRFLRTKKYKIIAPFPISPELVPYYINAADVLVQPSVQEGSSNLVKEAMACNCPIISTDSGDAVQVIGETRNCYITKFDPQDLAEKIDLILDNNSRTNGRNNIAHLEINIIAEKIIDIYKGVINEH